VLTHLQPPERRLQDKVFDKAREISDTLLRRRHGGVRVAGVDNLVVLFARCCNPIPGDEIIGLITRGRGVSVHRAGCSNLKDPGLEEERLIEVSWDADPEQTFVVKLVVIARDRRNLLAEMSQVIGAEGANIQGGEFSVEHDVARAVIIVEVRNLNTLQKILRAVRRIPGIDKIERYQVG
jgi:GTP pyrophosphokinase